MENLEFYSGLIGLVTGVVGLVISLYSIRHNRAVAVNEFLTKMESPEFIKARKAVYDNTYEPDCELGDEQTAEVINMFHHWGLLAKKRYLPMWVFNGACGNGVCRLYEKTWNYIESHRKKTGDPEYAGYFEWLYKKLMKKRKRTPI